MTQISVSAPPDTAPDAEPDATRAVSRATAGEHSTAISIRGVSKTFGAVRAVHGIDLDIATGEVVALLGPNGAGKSTTISMILDLLSPDQGTVTVGGRTPGVAVAGGVVAAMLQDSGPMPGVTVTELLGFTQCLYPAPLAVDEAMEMAGLGALGRRRVDKLSGGQAQRLRFAMVAIANPDILLLDEPTTAMDVAGRVEFWEAMRAYADSGHTVVFATHYLEEVDEFAGRVVVMVGGRIVADGTPASVRALAGGNVVRFGLAHPALDHPVLTRLADLPGATGVETHGAQILVRTTDSDATVRALAASDLAWRDLSVATASLDDSFLMLTKEKS